MPLKLEAKRVEDKSKKDMEVALQLVRKADGKCFMELGLSC